MIFKYYKGEKENPFSTEDVRAKFWHGEKVFSTTGGNDKEWVDYGQHTIKRLEAENENNLVATAKSFTPEQFGIIIFIQTLFEKWMPGSDMSWILDY